MRKTEEAVKNKSCLPWLFQW